MKSILMISFSLPLINISLVLCSFYKHKKIRIEYLQKKETNVSFILSFFFTLVFVFFVIVVVIVIVVVEKFFFYFSTYLYLRFLYIYTICMFTMFVKTFLGRSFCRIDVGWLVVDCKCSSHLSIHLSMVWSTFKVS